MNTPSAAEVPTLQAGLDPLAIDPAVATAEIVAAIRAHLVTLGRRGLVVAMSGGVDSSVSAALGVQAVGARRVFGLFLPEAESDPDSLSLAREVAEHFGIPYAIEDIAPILGAAGCYARRDAAIREIVPEYGAGWGCKVVMPGTRLDSDRLNVPLLVVQSPSGEMREVRLPAERYREIIAATNFKQRVRKMLEYHHADRLHYAVVGTPNRLEYDQGFFVKGGDGLADLKPIAHLFKSQVYQIGAHLGVPEEVLIRPPTTDTWSLPQSQEEFYFGLPTRELDRFLDAYVRGEPARAAAARLGYSEDQVLRVYRDIRQKRETTRYLHAGPLLVTPVPLDGPVPEVGEGS
jgi:NAD+ synthase